MPPFRKPTLVTLRRSHSNQAWGFRLGGGAEIGQPFQIQKVTPGSLAYLGGLSEGDELIRIGNISLRGLTHDEVQQIVLRCSLCIDLFVFRDLGGDITPRFELVNQPELFNRPEAYPRLTSAPVSPTYYNEAPMFNSHSNNDQLSHDPNVLPNPSIEPRQDFNRSPRPFDQNVSPTPNQHISSNSPFATQSQQVSAQQLNVQMIAMKPGSPIHDPRVFGTSRGSKSPIKRANSSQENSISPIPPINNQSVRIMPQTAFVSQSIPSTPTINKEYNFFGENHQDFNNNPMNGEKKVFGLPNRGASKTIAPIGNHGVQPMTNEFKHFGITAKQRHNSFAFERDWKESLPIVNIPNTDQLLPSQTRQMQTYINQTPPTEKNLRPSLIGLERRRIRPVWPPPHPNRMHRAGAYIEGRDSPNTKMFAWPPRAQSVDRDFSYGEGAPRYATPPMGQRGQTPDRGNANSYSSRVCSATRQWPPLSNATPAGASGAIDADNENYAYNPNGDLLTGLVSSHIPRTYRPPPGTQHIVVNDF